MSEVVQKHYEQLLSRHYSWMIGETIEHKAAEQLALLKALGLGPHLSGTAIDLGSGPGYQSFALAALGAVHVLAVDTSQGLLDELAKHAGDLPVEGRLADIRNLRSLCEPGSIECLVCMGDTLTHLPNKSDVIHLIADSFSALERGGTLVLTYRDLSQPPEGIDRFIPVRAENDRIMMCVLDFHPETVTVTDIVHRRDDGDWRMEKSSYEKLRLPAAWVEKQLTNAGFRVVRNEPAGRMQAVVARKPD